MATINLAEAELLRSSRRIPLIWSADRQLSEPWFDYDDEGNPQDFDMDFEPPDPTMEEIDAVDVDSLLYDVSPSQFAETAIRVPEAGRVGDFRFEGREYLRKIYDTAANRVLLKCGRQVEKTLIISTLCSRSDGSLVAAGDVAVGTCLATMSTDGVSMTTGTVTWVSRKYRKPCIRVKTRQGHEITIALTHPMRTWDSWTVGADLTVGTRLAAVRRCGGFTGKARVCGERIRLTGYLIGDGHIGDHRSFTSLPGVTVDEFVADAEATGARVAVYPKKGTPALDVRLSGDEQVEEWMRDDGLLGTRSKTKFVPRWVFRLSKTETAMFINRLWSTDGHVKQNSRSKYSIEYCSVSKRLVQDVQALLWKFGIPSTIRRNWPNYWKKKGVKNYAWILRIETREGVLIFLEDIACISKSEDTPIPEEASNNNRDILPMEVNELIRRIIDSRGTEDRYGRFADKSRSLRTAGLRETLKYPPTYEKVADYNYFFRQDDRYDQGLVDELERHLFTDLYWDRIVEIEDVGMQECVDFSVEGTENFVGEGLITHNSTTLGNRLLCYSALTNNFRSIFVAPSAEQAKVFSTDRIKDVVEASPLLKAYTTTKINQAVFFKKFINFSQIRLRYAYLTADRVRGIPADLVAIDEIQDVLVDNIPVIEQCAFHSKYKLFLYSGTPKSLDNTLEHYWTEFSTQNEWVVPCEHHGTPKDLSSWHWNILGEKQIGKKGLICDKCGAPISAIHPEAQWVSLNPRDEDNKAKVTFDGYRIPQTMVQWVNWDDILQAQEQYPRAQFMNEKLGMSYDSGVRPITKGQLKACCKDEMRIGDIEHFKRIAQGRQVYAGLDWGTGESSSFTVISFGGYFGTGNFDIFWIHRFTGPDLDPERQIDLISQMLSQLQVQIAGTDYGGGFYQNDQLIRRFGPKKIMKYQYNPRQKKKVYWEPNLGRFMLHRTEIMSDVFNALKRRLISLPNWEDFREPHGSDILNIFSEYNERLRMDEYKHAPGKPDDSFHSILYCLVASMLQNPRPDILTPMKDDGSGGGFHG